MNKVNCGAAGVLGSGTYNCPFNFERTAAVIYTTTGLEFGAAWSLSYLQTLQQQGNAVVYGKALTIEEMTPEDSINTYDTTGIETINGKRPRKMKIGFDNGIYNYKAADSMRSFGSYDVTYVDESRNILFTASTTRAKGFTLGQIGTVPYKSKTGNAPSSYALTHQELYRSEFDQDAAWVTAAEHDIRLADLDGVNDCTIAFEVAPGATDTTLQFSVKTAADNKNVTLGGLTTSNLLVMKNGSSASMTGSVTQNSSTKVYTLTLSSAVAEDDELELYLYDSAFAAFPSEGRIILKGGRLFKSNIATATVTA